jgi:aldose 1-epimerase
MLDDFGTCDDGRGVQAITLAAGALRVRVLTLGAILQSVRHAVVAHDLTLGSDRLADYLGDMRFHGSIVGPVANRISGGVAVIAGTRHQFPTTGHPPVTLHGGAAGTHAKVWTLDHEGDASATLSITLPAGEGGFPGTRRITARFDVATPATLRLTLTATTDAPTLMNLANHSYWNLDGTPDWSGHHLRIMADRVLAHHPDGRVRGSVLPVGGTPHDLRRGHRLRPDAPPLDHNYCLSDARRALTDAAVLTGRSGVSLTIATTEPGLQVYDGRAARRPGRGPCEGLAFEAQFWPDAPANPHFPHIVLHPGDNWQQITEWRITAPGPAA